jgi:N-acetylglucosaminyldiphosphoundecaprenol N-acetyl-beta-D-mannosaminyltransferase
VDGVRVSGQIHVVVGDIVVDLPTADAVMRRMASALDRTAAPVVLVSANLDHVHHFARGDRLPSGRCDGADWLTLLDGRPLVAAARRRRPDAHPMALPGSELLDPALRLAAARGARVVLVGGGAATRRYWSDDLAGRFPGLVAAGLIEVPWSRLDAPGGGAALAADVAATAPDLLVVSLGKPRQETWLRGHFTSTGAAVGLAFGSAVDYVAGTARRPPAWAQRAGAEWLVRLARDPRRLGRRYLVQGPGALRTVRRDLRVVDALARPEERPS